MKPRTAFIIMPFGQRELADGTRHDFDAFYSTLLRPVAQAEGFDVRRVDEIVASGTVSDQAFRLLYSADVVVADVSAPNSNVYYELGVRQAISPGLAILVAVAGTVLPFDIASQRVLFYSKSYLDDAAFRERYRDALLSPIELSRNPVQATLRELGVAPDPQVDRGAFERELTLKISRAVRDDQLLAVWHWAKQSPYLPTAGLLALADRLAKVEDYANAAAVLNAAYPAADDDFEVHRQRGFYLRKYGDIETGVEELHRALELNPNDPQALGMLAGTLKRQGLYAQALENYERALKIAPKSLYLRVARAGMVILADRERLQEGKELYADLRQHIVQSESLVGDYWADLVAAEANFVLGDQSQAYEHGMSAIRNGAPAADAQSTAEQIRMLGDAGVNRDAADPFASWLVERARNGGRGGIREYIETGNRTHIIFHISDTHFGSSVRKGGVLVNSHRFVDDENSRRLSLELKDEFQRALKDAQCSPADATIVLSGDITSSGGSEEFTLAERFLTELCDQLGIQSNQVVVVPGNHDIDWNAAKVNQARRFDNYLDFARKFFGDEFYKLFPLVKWDFVIGGERPQANEIIYVRRGGNLTFVGINSCVFEDDQHHYGFVGMQQLRNIMSLLEDEPAGRIIVAVMHHHLHPYPEPLQRAKRPNDVIPDISTIRDAGLVEQRLTRLGFSLVLHGHKHKAQLRETSVQTGPESSPFAGRHLIVCGCGSTGADEHELEHNQSNHYEIINFLRNVREPGANFVRVEWRELALQVGAEWRTSGRWVLKG